jgi:hypothetical protein
MNMRQPGYDAFVQDDWRIGSHLTVNAGLRYEYETPLHDINKVLTNLTWIDGKPWAYVGGPAGYPIGLAYPDRNNFAPRVGFSFNPEGGKTVVRAGYGRFAYPEMNLWCNQVHNVPLDFRRVKTNNFVPSINGFDFATPTLGKTTVGFTGAGPALADSVHPAGQRQLETARSATARWWKSATSAPGAATWIARGSSTTPRRVRPPLGATPTVSDDLVRRRDGAAAGLADSGMTFPVGPINCSSSPDAPSNALYVQAKRRLAGGLSYPRQLHVREEHDGLAVIPVAGDGARGAQDSFNLSAEWGPAGCDIRHRFVMSLIYQIPFSSRAPSSGAWEQFARVILGDWQWRPSTRRRPGSRSRSASSATPPTPAPCSM